MEEGKGRTDLKFLMVQGLPTLPFFETQEMPWEQILELLLLLQQLWE